MKKTYKKKTIVLLSASLLLASKIAPVLATTINEKSNVVPTEELDKTQTVTNSGEKESSANNLVTVQPKETTSSLNTSTPISESKTVTNINPDQEDQKENPISISDEAIDSWMPDKNLQKIVSNMIGIPIKEITPERLQSFSEEYDLNLTDDTNLSGNPNQISNLQGLQYLPSVFMTLDLYHISNTKSSVDFSYFFETQDHYIAVNNHNVDFTNFGLFYNYLYFDNGSEKSSSTFNLRDTAWDIGNYRESQVDLDLEYSSLKEFKVSINDFYQRGNIGVGNLSDGGDPTYEYQNFDELDYEGLDEDYNDASFLGYGSFNQSKGNTLIYAIFTDGNNLVFKWRKGELSINEPNTSLALKGEFNHTAIMAYSSKTSQDFAFITNLNINIHLNLIGSVKVNYLYNDLPVAESKEISGLINSAYSTSPLQIEGYSLDKTTGNPQGKFSDKVQIVNYIYKKTSVKAAEVTTKYVDTEGNSISEEITQSGNVGDTYKTEQKDIEGYIFKEVQGNATGQFTNQPQTITYVYTKNELPNLTGTVLVEYVNTDGSKISEDIVKSGTVGEGYSTEKKDIKGYTFKEVQGSTTGQFTEQVQTVTYVYTKNKVNPVNPEPKPENKSSSNDKNNNQGTISSTQHDLPATGENERITVMSIILGLVLLTVAMIISIFRFKKVNK